MTRHPRLFDLRMHDGSRHFFDIPERVDAEPPEWHGLRKHLNALPDFQVTGFLTDYITEAWIDFRHQGHRFSLNNQHGSWWAFVDDPACPDAILIRVAEALLSFSGSEG
jgi:hypothetical protein